MIDVTSIHPCAIAVQSGADKNRLEITYRHTIVKGSCVVCREPVIFLTSGYVTAQLAEPSKH